MRSLKILSSALCAWLALGGCSLEDNSTPSVPVDASSQGGASGAGPSSGASGATSQGAGGASGSGGPSTGAGGSAGAGGSSGGTTVVMMDASNEASGDATPANGDAGGCPGLFCEDFEADQFDSTKWNVQTVG